MPCAFDFGKGGLRAYQCRLLWGGLRVYNAAFFGEGCVLINAAFFGEESAGVITAGWQSDAFFSFFEKALYNREENVYNK